MFPKFALHTSSLLKRFLSAGFLCLTVAPLHAETITLTPGDGVQTALDRAKAGDTVRLKPGVYRERVVFRSGGTNGKPVVLEGEAGAILDGSENVALDWQAAPDVAPGVYRAKVPFNVFTLTADGKIVTMLREDRVKIGATEKDKEGNLWDYQKLFQNGVGPSKWQGVKALALYLEKPKELLVRFQNNLDPRQMKMTVAPREPIIQIADFDRCVVRGLTLRNAAYGVFVENSLGSVVENCVIGPVDYGVWLASRADRITIRFNEIFMNPYAGADPKGVGAWDNWTAHKRGGYQDRFGVQIHKTAGGHEVHDNDIHDHWDGIEDRGVAGENRGLRIHHNRIFNVSDDGLEPNGAEEDCQWNNNIVEKSLCAFRIKAPHLGPMYAYRNIFLSNGEDFRNYGEVELKPAKIFIYHNTSTSPRAIQSNKVFGIGTPNYHYFNNLFWCVYWWGNSGPSVLPNWKGDYNVYLRRETDPRWDESKAIAQQQKIDEHSLWTNADPAFTNWAKGDVSLRANSPARGRGTDLSKLFGNSLPGLEKGAKPDAGALQLGEAMPQLPRDARTVNVAAAGNWPGPEADAQREKENALAPILWSESFENGLKNWGKAQPENFQIKTEKGNTYLHLTTQNRGELAQKISSLVPGQNYSLSFMARSSTFSDARVIVRNLADAKYLGSVTPTKNTRWQRQTLNFVAAAPEANLEISLRSAGTCDLDDFVLRKARP